MKINEIITESYQPPKLEVGDKILKGKFKNSPAEIKGFKKDKHNQPVLKTNKGDVQLFKPRIAKLDVNENSLNEFAITPDDGPDDGKQAGRWLVTYMDKNGITKEKIKVGKNANTVAKYFEFKYRRKPLSVVPYFDDIDLRGSLGLDEAKKRKAKRRSSYKGYYGAWGFGDSGSGEGGE